MSNTAGISEESCALGEYFKLETTQFLVVLREGGGKVQKIKLKNLLTFFDAHCSCRSGGGGGGL